MTYAAAQRLLGKDSELASIFELRGAPFSLSSTVTARANAFAVAWDEVKPWHSLEIDSATEYLALLIDTGAWLISGEARVEAPARSICILPAGCSKVSPSASGRIVRLFAPVPASISTLIDLGCERNVSLQPILPGFSRAGGPQFQAYAVDQSPHSPEMPRARLFQCSTMSINWVEYEGPRDRTNLSPHSHVDFEQGSLAIEGEFVHHLRATWGPDARRWRADEHLAVGAGSLAIIPPSVVHTTERCGTGAASFDRHLCTASS